VNTSDLDAGLPANVDAEKTILGALMLAPERLLDVVTALTPDDFSLDSHRRILRRMVEVSEEFESLDLISLSNTLAKHKEIQSIGGVAYLASLTEGLPRRPEISDYLKIVKDKSICRQMMRIGSTTMARAADQSEPGLEIASWAISAISEVADHGQTKPDVFDAKEMADSAEYRLIDNPSETPAIPTGLRSLDEFTGGGIRLGELWVIGAASSRGKTTLARQIVKNCISRGVPCYVHSGEMSKESWFDVTAALVAEMPVWGIREPRLMNSYEREQLRCGIRKLGEMPFYLSDPGGIHLDRLIWNAMTQKRKHGIQVLAVDYAQIIDAPGREDRQRVTAVAQRLRLFAKDEGVGVILLSQSPRPSDSGSRINTRPTMFSLKESGSLEEAAHAVILPYRPIDVETGAFTGEDELIIGKQRWGSIGSIPISLNGKYLRFEERLLCAR
jgi:replicative DNA helicase